MSEENFDIEPQRFSERRRLRKIKDSELFEVVEEVFDYRTLMALYDLLNRGIIWKMYGAVASGKEARIYWAEDKHGRDLAVKIFLVSTAEFRKSRLIYIEGDPRFKRVSGKIRDIVRVWCSKEFRNLQRAHDVGVRVPEPIAYKENILVMEFIDAGIRGVPAPLLKEAPPQDPNEAYKWVISSIEALYLKGKLIHADLSEYNILNKGEDLYIIDWGSAVHINHPHADEFLLRDLRNVTRYFERLKVDVEDPEDVYKKLKSSLQQ
ncbi:MAG TPA: serine protein kinase RIO [Thermofilum sp.]|nr:serine protein kinase RIO [Thermofilum sp.]